MLLIRCWDRAYTAVPITGCPANGTSWSTRNMSTVQVGSPLSEEDEEEGLDCCFSCRKTVSE